MAMRPNILFFLPDQLRADWVGPQNAGRARTPNVDALMARGVTFRNAICPSPLCGPSRACLATGLEYDRNPVPNNDYSIDLDGPNFYRQLAAAGYDVLTCGKVDLLKGELDWGADGLHRDAEGSRLYRLGFTGGLDSAGKHATLSAWATGKGEPYLAFLRKRGLEQAHVADMQKRKGAGERAGANYINTEPCPLPDDAYQDGWVGECGLDCLRALDGSRPWFLQVNFAGPHEPMNITQSMAKSVESADPPLPADLCDIEVQTHRAIRRTYTAMVEFLDAMLGRYVDFLRETGQLERTIIIFASDHGEMLGDAGRWKKSQPHQPSIGIPLVLAGPGIAAGKKTDQPATFLDLHATMIDLAQAQPLPGIDSRSLLPALADPTRQVRDVVFSGLGHWRIAFDGTFKIIAGFDPSKKAGAGPFTETNPENWRLVRVGENPAETGDLTSRYPEIAARLKALLQAQVTRAPSSVT
jgi:arylsulfatase A-like enzyme